MIAGDLRIRTTGATCPICQQPITWTDHLPGRCLTPPTRPSLTLIPGGLTAALDAPLTSASSRPRPGDAATRGASSADVGESAVTGSAHELRVTASLIVLPGSRLHRGSETPLPVRSPLLCCRLCEKRAGVPRRYIKRETRKESAS